MENLLLQFNVLGAELVSHRRVIGLDLEKLTNRRLDIGCLWWILVQRGEDAGDLLAKLRVAFEVPLQFGLLRNRRFFNFRRYLG